MRAERCQQKMPHLLVPEGRGISKKRRQQFMERRHQILDGNAKGVADDAPKRIQMKPSRRRQFRQIHRQPGSAVSEIKQADRQDGNQQSSRRNQHAADRARPKQPQAWRDGDHPEQQERKVGLFHTGRQRGGQQRQPQISHGFCSARAQGQIHCRQNINCRQRVIVHGTGLQREAPAGGQKPHPPPRHARPHLQPRENAENQPRQQQIGNPVGEK